MAIYHIGNGYTIYAEVVETYISDGSGGTWFTWNCTCFEETREYRTLKMMRSTIAQHIGEHEIKANDKS